MHFYFFFFRSPHCKIVSNVIETKLTINGMLNHYDGLIRHIGLLIRTIIQHTIPVTMNEKTKEQSCQIVRNVREKLFKWKCYCLFVLITCITSRCIMLQMCVVVVAFFFLFRGQLDTRHPKVIFKMNKICLSKWNLFKLTFTVILFFFLGSSS